MYIFFFVVLNIYLKYAIDIFPPSMGKSIIIFIPFLSVHKFHYKILLFLSEDF